MNAAPAEHTSRSLIWALIESGGLSLISLAVLIVVARQIGPAELGAFAIAIGIVQVLTLIVEMLVHDAIIQRQHLSPGHLDTAFWTCLGLGLMLTTACWLAAPVVGGFFDSAGVAVLLPVAGLSLVFSGAACVPVAMLRREVRFKPLALRSLVGRVCGAAVAVVLIAIDYGVWALIAQHVVQIAACTLLLWPATRWRPSLRYSPARLWDLFSFGAFNVGTRLVWLSSARLFILLIGNMLGVAAVGYINIAQRMVDTLFSLLAGAAHNLALPIFARRQTDRELLVRAYSQATEFATLAAQPLFAGLAVCAFPLISVFLGDDWGPAAPLVQVLAIGAMLQFIFLFGDPILMALGRPGFAFGLSLLTFSLVMSAVFIVRPDSAFEGTLIWASRILVGGPILVFIVSRLLKLSLTHIVKLTWLPMSATVAMVAPLLFIDTQWLSGISPIAQLAVLVPLGALFYSGSVAIMGRKTFLRLMRFVLSGFRPAAVVHTPAGQ